MSQRTRVVIELFAALAVIAASATLVWTSTTASKGRSRTAQAEVPLPESRLSLRDVALRGSQTAPVGLIVISDFQCPFCARFANATLPRINAKFVETGRVLLAFRHLPIESIHPAAKISSHAAICAGRQGRFWEMHDALFQDQPRLGPELNAELASRIGLVIPRFTQCMAQDVSSELDSDLRFARSLKVAATPTLFLGVVTDGPELIVRRALQGVQNPEILERELNNILASVGR